MQSRAKEIADRKGGDTLAWAEAYDAVNAEKAESLPRDTKPLPRPIRATAFR